MRKIATNIFLNKYSLLSLAVLLFIFSLSFNKLYSDKSSVAIEARLLEKYLHRQQKDFNEFLSDNSLIQRLVEKKESLQEFEKISAKGYGIYVMAKNVSGKTDLKFWSEQLVLPPPETYTMEDGEYFEKLANGYYLVSKNTLSQSDAYGKTLVYALFPIQSAFFIETEYLPHQFAYSKTAAKKVLISEKPTDFPVKSMYGKTIFYLDKKMSGAVPYNDRLTIILRLSAVFLLLLFFHLLAESVVRKWGALRGISLLTVSLVALRLSVYFFPSLFNLRQFELFNPAIYGSNMALRSLGDLLINAAFFCWIILFAWSKFQHQENLVTILPRPLKWPAGIGALCLLILSTFLLATVVRSMMVADSKISFDVTNFFSMNQYTVIGFVVLACLSFSYYYFTQLLFRFIFPLFKGQTIIVYFIIGFAGLLYLTIRSGDPTVLFYLPVLLWLLLYTWLVSRQGILFSRFRISIAGIIFWIFIFSASIAAIMFSENKKVEWERRKLYVEKLVDQTDPSSERLLSIALQYLDKSFLADNFYRFADSIKGKTFRDSIITENYSGYLNKYDTRLYVYNANDKGLYNEDSLSYDGISTMTAQAAPTRIPDIYYYENSFDKFTYITKRIVRNDAGGKIGSLFIISNPKKYSSEALFPELFKQKQSDPENSPIYSYAIYNNKRLISPSNKYPFATSLTDGEIPNGEFEKRMNGDFDELWYRASNEKIVVMARKRDTTIETITLFSYIFCSFLFMVAFVQFISLVLKAGYNPKELRKLLQFNIRSQVHSTIISISVISFLVIGVATISFFISRYNRNNNDKLSRTMKIMVNEMQKKQATYSTFDSTIKIYDSIDNNALKKLVDEVSDIHDVNVNVYDLGGNLKVSSEPNVYSKGVLSTKMDPSAFYHLSRLRQVQHAQEERIGNLSYLSMYAPVRDEDGKVYTYLNIPYFTSQQELSQEISNFLVAIINLNAFIFLIAGVISLFITNRITRSFTFISDKMKEVNLGKKNEAISWKREDEIGELVKEYNKMVAKLGESAEALAKSEREGAWREMARQVAHEIKNPLTPMKLSIQYLQKSIDNNYPNIKELSGSVAKTLVEQIDHLSKIAADFSQFANIGNVSAELFDLHDVIGSLKELYSQNPNVKIDWKPVPDKIMLRADKTQMNRLFTNLFANAVDACNGNGNGLCRIEVNEEQNSGAIKVSVKDNGEGIAPEMESKIFIPNFTTKSSGTGLGLAMCKGIVEQAKGKIWFETGKQRGTTFHVLLPLTSANDVELPLVN